MTTAGVGRLADAAVLAAWEEGLDRGPVERAVALAAYATAASREDVERWTVGERDAVLLATQAATFGARVAALTSCPDCSDPLELTLDTRELYAAHGDAGREYELRAGDGVLVRFRLPTSADLLAGARVADARAARQLILDRCVVAVERDGAPVAVSSLEEAVIADVAACMAEHDPQSDVRLALSCAACAHNWNATLDIVDFLWREVDDCARGIVTEVARLAAAFGWSEDEILALSDTRRRLYLDLVGT